MLPRIAALLLLTTLVAADDLVERYRNVPGFPTDPEQARLAAAAMEQEATGRWKTIQWREQLPAALAEARKRGRPLLVYFVVSEKGRKGAEHC